MKLKEIRVEVKLFVSLKMYGNKKRYISSCVRVKGRTSNNCLQFIRSFEGKLLVSGGYNTNERDVAIS